MAEQVDSVRHKVRGGVQCAACMKANETRQSKITKFIIYSGRFILERIKMPSMKISIQSDHRTATLHGFLCFIFGQRDHQVF